jgi:hypothetical protein
MTARDARRKADDGCLPLQLPFPPPLLLHPGNGLMSVLILNENVFSQISTSVNVSGSRPNEKRRISSSCENDLSPPRDRQSYYTDMTYYTNVGEKSAKI